MATMKIPNACCTSSDSSSNTSSNSNVYTNTCIPMNISGPWDYWNQPVSIGFNAEETARLLGEIGKKITESKERRMKL